MVAVVVNESATIMADILLRVAYHFPSGSDIADLRAFRAYQSIEGSDEPEIELYKVRVLGSGKSCIRPERLAGQFLHPMTQEQRANTTFYRKNLNTGNYETAGSIEWSTDWSARVTWGIDTVCPALLGLYGTRLTRQFGRAV